jgi:hypothetical protein
MKQMSLKNMGLVEECCEICNQGWKRSLQGLQDLCKLWHILVWILGRLRELIPLGLSETSSCAY